MSTSKPLSLDSYAVAGNGLLHRRLFLAKSATVLGVGGLSLISPSRLHGQATLQSSREPRSPGRGMSEYGVRSMHENHVRRTIASAPGTTGAGISRTPLEYLEGTITPSALHFERHHSGVPNIDPDEHRLLIHGLAERSLVFDMNALCRYPMVSRIQFLECSGNSGSSYSTEPVMRSCGGIHGLVSCSEWTGIPLAVLLEEAGADPTAEWLLVEGADAAVMARSVPMRKALDDALIALYQNGERLRPENGYPIRLLLPGYEGNMNVKWLRRIEVTRNPTMTRWETSKYSDTFPDGTSLMFTYPMRVKSVITSPSPGLLMRGPGLYEICGLAWSGLGRVTRVEVSVDTGLTWGDAALSEPVLPIAMTRFRIPWRWNGAPSVILSRATDETGAIQPPRSQFIASVGNKFAYHYNAIQAWRISENGEITNVYA